MRRAFTIGCIAAGLAVAAAPAAAPRARAELTSVPPHLANAPGDLFGSAVAVWRSTAVVAARGVNNFSGAVYIYVRSGGSWHQQARLLDPQHTNSDDFGNSVAVSGGTVIIGAPTIDAGSAYIYVRSGAAWQQQAALTGATFDYFGAAVAIAGNTAVIGAVNANNNIGAAYVYVRSGSTWRKRAKFTLPGGGTDVYFGDAVAVSGNTVVVGAPYEYGGIGAAYIYVRSGGRWRRQKQLIDPVHTGSGNFGSSVALVGGTVMISAPAARNGRGAVYIYQRSGTSWRSQARIANPGSRASRGFGSGVALATTPLGIRALIGAANGETLLCGTAYDYTRSGARWREKAKIVNPGCKPGDGFGGALGLYRRTAVIGAQWKNKNTGAVYELTIP